MKATVDTILKIHSREPPGDILAFLTGQEEVERTVRMLEDSANANMIQESGKKNPEILILPMYGSLPYMEQLKVFRAPPKGTRKVVIATNVAETSITISGIVYGEFHLCRTVRSVFKYNNKLSLQLLTVVL